MPARDLPTTAPAATRAYEWTRRAVLSGDIDTGDLITEGEVAEAVGVSRTPVREAFLRLEAEGVLRLFPKRGALVVPVTAAEVRAVIEARTLVESWAFALAAGARPDGAGTGGEGADGEGAGGEGADEEGGDGEGGAGLVGTLEAHIAVQARCLAAGDDAGFQEADRAFHTVVVEAAGNQLLSGFYRSLRDRQLRIGTIATSVDADRSGHILAEHRALAAAVGAGDAALARHLVVAHVEATGAAFRRG